MYGQYSYGQYVYGDNGNLVNPDIEQFTPDLMEYLPSYYQEVETMKDLQSPIAKELGTFAFQMHDLIDKQLFIETATWRLTTYEKELGLQTNMSLSFEERREIIKAKLRGSGTTTKSMIISTAQAFSGGEVDVIEYHGESKFVIKFIGVKGIPRNMQSFIDMLENIKPAHLEYEIKYSYTVWDFINQLNWNQASQNTWDELKTYEGV